MEKKKAILILDFGTSNVRADLINPDNGKVEVSRAIKNQWIKPQQGWSEMDADLLWGNSREVVAQIIELTKKDYQITSLGFSYFGDSLILADEEMSPLGNMIMAFDTRAQDEAAYLEKKIGKAEFRRIIGGPCLSMLVCSKLLWLKNHEPQLFKRARYFLNIQEFILNKLGLGVCTDYTLANRKTMLDITQKEWSMELIEAIGIEKKQLGGTICDSTDIVGTIRAYGTVKLPYEIPVVLGAHDSECGFLGLGINPADNCIIGNVSGTYEMIGSFSDECIQEQTIPEVELGCGLHRDNMVVSGSSIAGSYVEWFRREICRSPANMFEELEQKINYDGSGELFFLGDNDKHACTLEGFHTSTKDYQIYQSMIEGITYKLKTIIDEMERINEVPYHSLRCGGGGSDSDKWLQFKADLFHKDVQRVKNSEVSSVGAAIIAAVGTGYYRDFSQAIQKMVQVEKVFTPNHEMSERYQKKYLQYKSKILT